MFIRRSVKGSIKSAGNRFRRSANLIDQFANNIERQIENFSRNENISLPGPVWDETDHCVDQLKAFVKQAREISKNVRDSSSEIIRLSKEDWPFDF